MRVKLSMAPTSLDTADIKPDPTMDVEKRAEKQARDTAQGASAELFLACSEVRQHLGWICSCLKEHRFFV
jgi:hypothetical protein